MARSQLKRFAYERPLWESGLELVAGVDEAGRGPLAGPVVAAAVVFPCAWREKGLPKKLQGLNDSKQLSAARREEFFAMLTTMVEVGFAVGQADVVEIDSINILYASHLAMNRALAQLAPAPHHVLVDGLRVGSITFPQTAIVKGDALSYSIAAASVIAKVTRDRMLVQYHQQWPEYGFAEHKGYSTPQHLAALWKHGPCPIHRRSFEPVRQPQLF